MNRIATLSLLAILAVALSGCFGFEPGAGASDFRPGTDFEETGNTVHLKAAVADLVMHEVYPGFHANLWAWCFLPADPSDTYSADAIEVQERLDTDGQITGVSQDFIDANACSVPGPTLRIKQGDKVIVDFTNNHFHAHTIHWHGQYVPWESDGVPGVTQDSVNPDGSTFRYEFIASRAGTLWYHCHVDTHFHVMQGLYGAFIVEPQDTSYEPEDIDKEYVFVYSSVNRGLVQVTPTTAADPHINHRHKAGECGASGVQGCQNPPVDTYPDTWMLNGRSAPNSFEEMEQSVITGKTGDRIRLRFLNAGETFETIHTHGHDMYVTHRDGNPIPPSARFYVDTLTIGPAERYDVVLEMDRPSGIWIMHSHVDHHVANDHMNPGGAITFIAYEDTLEETGGLVTFPGANPAGGLPFITPLDIPLDVQYGRDRNVGGGLDPTSQTNVAESWSFPWDMPCATRLVRLTVELDPDATTSFLGDLVQGLSFRVLDKNGDQVVAPTQIPAGGRGTWELDGRFNILDDQEARDATTNARKTMIEEMKAGEFTVEVTGTAPPGTLRFHVELDYHDSEDTLIQESSQAALDLNKGEAQCAASSRVFDPTTV